MSSVDPRRRALLIASLTAALPGCTTSSADDIPRDITRDQVGYTPQFLLGDERCTHFVEIAFSLHCGATRKYFHEHGRRLFSDIRKGKTLAYFSHFIRTPDEIPVGVVAMSVGKENYSEAIMAVLGFSIQQDRSLSEGEVKTVLQKAGFSLDLSSNMEKYSRLALGAVRQTYQTGLGVSATPYISESGIG